MNKMQCKIILQSSINQPAAWLTVCIGLLVAGLASWGLLRWLQSNQRSSSKKAIQNAQQQHADANRLAHNAMTVRDAFTLEVYGAGVVVEQLKHGQLWQSLQGSDFHACVTPDRPGDYPWDERSKDLLSATRSQAASQGAFGYLGWKWICPILRALPPDWNPTDDHSAQLGNVVSGPPMQSWTRVVGRYDEVPDLLWSDAFDFFEANPDIPLCALGSTEGITIRNDMLCPGPNSAEEEKQPPPGTPFRACMDGEVAPHYIRDAYTSFALGRRDRVDALRPYAFSINPNLYPHPVMEYRGGREIYRFDAPVRPTVPLPPLPGSAEEKAVVASFKPTKWFRRPWAKFQIAQFDARPLMARIHRPQRVEYRDASGRRLTAKQRNQAFLEAWKRALAALPEGQKPVRLIYDAGGPSKASHLVPLSHALHEAGPDLEIMGKEAVDLTARFGNTGASSPFVAVALGVYASYQDGGVSACISLRANDHATILMVSPPNAEDKARNAKVHPWNPAEWIPEEGNGLVEPEWLKKQSSRLPLGTERPSNSRCPEPGLWQCAHAEHADGRLRHFSQDEWFPEALLLHRRLLWRKEELLDTTWTLIAYPDPQGGIGPEETSHG